MVLSSQGFELEDLVKKGILIHPVLLIRYRDFSHFSAVAAIEYTGCYLLASGMTVHVATSSSMTPQVCAGLCKHRG